MFSGRVFCDAVGNHRRVLVSGLSGRSNVLARSKTNLSPEEVKDKVHIVNAQAAAAGKVRVVIRSADQNDVWGTVGVSENIIEASCLALVDSVEYMLTKNGK